MMNYKAVFAVKDGMKRVPRFDVKRNEDDEKLESNHRTNSRSLLKHAKRRTNKTFLMN